MLDVVGLLKAPAPWETHGATAPLPPALAAMLADWPGEAADFFRSSGPVEEAIRTGSHAAPGLVFGDAAEEVTLTLARLSDLQARITALAGQDRPHRLILRGAIAWDGTLAMDDLRGLTLDFTGAEVQVMQDSAPLIRLTRSQRVTLRGLRIGQRHRVALDVAASQDVALTDSAFAGATEAAVHLSGGAARVLVDRCAFLRNTGAAVAAQGEVAGLIVARSTFDGPSRRSFIDLAAALSARGYAAPTGGAPARDALTRMHPTDVRLLDNRFGALDQPAILAAGTVGLWVERNDFPGAGAGAVQVCGPALGVMIADNRMPAPADASAPLVQMADVALAAVFRNVMDAAGPGALTVQGQFGGVLIAGNLVMIPADPAFHSPAALRLEPTGAGFLSTTVMLNTIRGGFTAGLTIGGPLPRLFLFDNHLFGMTDWSIESPLPQPMVTSMNNWSPVKSLNVPLSEALIEVARMVRG